VGVLDPELREILDRLTSRAWRDARGDQPGGFPSAPRSSAGFVVLPAELAPLDTPAAMHAALTSLYEHARRWAPGLDVPFSVPPVRIRVLGDAGRFVVDEERYASIFVSGRFAGDPASVRLILAHEACHDILRQSDLARRDDVRIDEITTDLAMFVCGFGELVLAGHTHVARYGEAGEVTHLGYLNAAAYRAAHEHVLSARATLDLPVHGAPAAISEPERAHPVPAGGEVVLWCGEAMCKRSFSARLRREGKPWPVRCPRCGVFLYPGEILERSRPGELEPQAAELRLQAAGGRLVACSAAELERLAGPPLNRPTNVGAAMIEEILAGGTAASPPAPRVDRSPRPLVTHAPPARVRAAVALAVVLLAALGVVLVAWLVSQR
jgi:hypothetical protein